MTTHERAVTVIEQSTTDAMVEWNLDEFPTERFNRLVPTQTLNLPTDLLRPVVQVVQLNPDAENGGDVYTSRDMPNGHAAPTKVALRKFATAAGISFVDERRVDDGRDPDVIEIVAKAEMLLPTGQRLTAIGSKRIDLNAQTWASPAQRAKYKSFFQEHVASRAENRAIRALLSLRGSYPLAVYAKPFAVVSFAPNMAHPEVRARILEAMTPAVSSLYGPAADQKALAPGQTINVSPAPEDDAAPDKPTALPGEKLAKADAGEEPDWLKAGVAPVAAKATTDSDLVQLLRDTAGSSNLNGDAKDPQLAKLRPILQPLGGGVVAGAIRAVWGEDAVARLSAAQAQALLNVAASRETFAAEFTALAAVAA